MLGDAGVTISMVLGQSEPLSLHPGCIQPRWEVRQMSMWTQGVHVGKNQAGWPWTPALQAALVPPLPAAQLSYLPSGTIVGCLSLRGQPLHLQHLLLTLLLLLLLLLGALCAPDLQLDHLLALSPVLSLQHAHL